MTWFPRVLILLIFGVSAAMANELVDFKPKDSQVTMTAAEFAGVAARIAKRRDLPATEGATGLEYLVFADDVRVAALNHQWAAKAAAWPEIDLVQFIGTVNPGSPLEKKIGQSAPYERGGASGRVVHFSMQEGTEGMACVAYDVKAGAHRLTGFICLPGTAPLTPEDAKRLVGGLGIKGVLPPG